MPKRTLGLTAFLKRLGETKKTYRWILIQGRIRTMPTYSFSSGYFCPIEAVAGGVSWTADAGAAIGLSDSLANKIMDASDNSKLFTGRKQTALRRKLLKKLGL